MELSNDVDGDGDGFHSDDEECPICQGNVCPTLVDQILKAAENFGPPMSAQEFSQWLRAR